MPRTNGRLKYLYRSFAFFIIKKIIKSYSYKSCCWCSKKELTKRLASKWNLLSQDEKQVGTPEFSYWCLMLLSRATAFNSFLKNIKMDTNHGLPFIFTFTFTSLPRFTMIGLKKRELATTLRWRITGMFLKKIVRFSWQKRQIDSYQLLINTKW